MSSVNPFMREVSALSDADFVLLQQAVTYRRNAEKYGYSTLEEAATSYQRKAVCPRCGSESFVKNGNAVNGTKRYICSECGKEFGILSGTVFNSTNADFDTWARYITCMIHYPSLAMTEAVCNISHPTAFLWRHKIFATVDGYQDHLILKGRIWIDETYIDDSTILHEFGQKRKRGLSKDKICIVVAIDQNKNMIAVPCGNGKPSSRMIQNALLSHIEPGSTIVHDGEHAHMALIRKLKCEEELYKANLKDQTVMTEMRLVNNLCGWLKRYLSKFAGMKMKNLHSYLNWFVYLFRVKRDREKWPETTRVIRHLLLSDARYVRFNAV